MSGMIAAHLRDMTKADIDAVVAIEQQVHSHPWTRGMFIDALMHGNVCKVYSVGNEIIGYAVLLAALDEVELLDISIAQKHQRKGLGERLLGEMLSFTQENEWVKMILEVRRSNFAAHILYRKSGFIEIGLRRAYYATETGREDAIVMERKFT